MPFAKGDVFRYVLPGGGGWGDPLDRNPDDVLSDVRNDLISTETARAEYGVVIDTETWTVDTVQTDALKTEKRRQATSKNGQVATWDDQDADTPPTLTAG